MSCFLFFISVKLHLQNANQEESSEIKGSNAATVEYVRGDRLLVKKDSYK